MSFLRRSLFFLTLLLFAACSSTNYQNSAAHDLFRMGDYSGAAEGFGKKAQESGANQLLYLLDQGTALFAARNYSEAIKVFLRAEDLAEIKDYTSVSEEVGSLVSSGNVRGYKGEDFEKVMINVYLALAFAAQGNIGEAQVEARKINLLLYRLNNEGKRHYGEAPFARYLSALLWDAGNELNSAYVDYKKTYELDPAFPGLGSDLISTSRRMRLFDDEKMWRDKFPGQEGRVLGKRQGELIVFFEKGLSPIKRPRPEATDLPMYVSRASQSTHARVTVNGTQFVESSVFVDIESISDRWLEDRIGRMRTANIAGAVVKGMLAAGVGAASKSRDAGILTFIALMATDQADLRSWLTLPQNIQVARLPLNVGTYSVDVDAMMGSSALKRFPFPGVQIKEGKKTFLIVR